MNQKKKRNARILAWLLAAVMLVLLVPTAVFADETNSAEPAVTTESSVQNADVPSEETADSGSQNANEAGSANLPDTAPAEKRGRTSPNESDATEESPGLGGTVTAKAKNNVLTDSDAVDVSIEMNALASTAKLFTWTDETKGDTDLLSEIAVNGRKYAVSLEPGNYLLEGYSADGSLCYGSIVIPVSALENSFQVFTVSGIKANNEGWTAGTDYSIKAAVKSKDYTKDRKAILGTDGNAASLLCLYNDSVEISLVPDETLHPEYGTFTDKQTVYSNLVMSGTITVVKNVTVKAPKGTRLQLVDGGTYYDYKVFKPSKEETDGDTLTASFRVSKANAIRAYHPDGVLTWKWLSGAGVKDGDEFLLSAEDLHIGNAFGILPRGGIDQADIRLNINEKGYLNLNEGETFEINATRVWQAVKDYMNTNTGMPDFTYQVIDPQTGAESDVLEVVPRDPNNWQADLTAKKAGTALVLVTYGSMYDPATMSGSNLSAIWPENTGVFVVSVGADGSAIESGMKINESLGFSSYKLAGEKIDAEMDVLYYKEGTDGATYSFTPEAGSVVEVLHPTLTAEKMTYTGGFGTDGVTVDADGKVTLSKLSSGRHIVRITKDGLSTYQVITAKPVSYVITDMNGKEVKDNAVIPAGSEITVTYTGLFNPAEKQSGVYNFTSRVFLTDDLGFITYNRDANTMGVYTFNATKQEIKLTIPENWSEDTITYTGGIATSAFGGKMGIHRVVDYDTGLGQNAYNAMQLGHLCSLPVITLNVRPNDERLDAQFCPMDGETLLENVKYTLVNADGATVKVKQDGSFMALPGNYKYTAEVRGYNLAHGEIKIAADSENRFVIAMEKSSKGAWDGKSTKEPQTDENGVYRIGTPAEYIWFVNAKNAGTITDHDLVLTADLDFADYPFDAIKSILPGFTFDGQNHTISHLYVDQTVTGYTASFGGLINTLQGNLKNLTVNGSVSYVVGTGANWGLETGYFGGIVGSFHNNATTTIASNLENVTSNIDLCVDITNCFQPQIGGIVGGNSNSYYLAQKNLIGEIRHCVNNGTVTVTDNYGKGKNPVAVGGIIGFAESVIDLINCANHGNVSLHGDNLSAVYIAVGGLSGVLGTTMGSSTTQTKRKLDACYNTGSVSLTAATGNAAGLAAETGNLEADGNYNAGRIEAVRSATDYTGTSVPQASALIASVLYDVNSFAKNSYNSGVIAAAGGATAINAGGTSCYYLTGTGAENKNGNEVTESGLKALFLGDKLIPTCDGYPQVYWETANFHDGRALGVVEPTCTEPGGHFFMCRKCGSFYVRYDVDATGHRFCEHTGPEACEQHTYTKPTCTHPGKLVQTCLNGCGETKETVIDPSGHIPDESGTKCSICGRSIQVPELKGTDSFCWVYDEEDGRWESNTQGQKNKNSRSTIELDLPAGGTFSFNYGCDTGTLDASLQMRIDGPEYIYIPSCYQNEDGYFWTELKPGKHTVTFTYKRSTNDVPEKDYAWVDNLVVHSHVCDLKPAKEIEISPATCTEEGVYKVICEECGETDLTFTTEPLGHTLKDTCEEQTCPVCHEKITLDHVFCDHNTEELCIENPDCPYHTYTPATCFSKGSIVQVCKYGCGTSKTIELTNQPAHTLNAEGTKCTECGSSLSKINSLTDGATYPWAYNETEDRWESTIQGLGGNNGNASISTFSFTLEQAGNVCFDYGCNTGATQSNRGNLQIQINDGSKTTTLASNVFKVDRAHYAGELPAGSYTVTLRFNKTSTAANGFTAGMDFGWVSNIFVHTHKADLTALPDNAIHSAATCTESGSFQTDCEECHASFTGVIPALGHDLKETVVPPTCTEGGYTEYCCLREGCEEAGTKDETDPLGHDYEAEVTEPTADKGGYTTYTCKRCGDSYVTDYIAPLDGIEVYLSVSHDAQFMTDEGEGNAIALRKVKVPYFDLARYGLQGYYLNEDPDAAYGKVTILHLFLYATELFRYGLEPSEAGKGFLKDEGILGTDELQITGGNGSLLLNKFWGMDLNLNYYYNMVYPLASEAWGATADQIVMKPGDVVTISHFTSWNFFNDPSSVYNYLSTDGESVFETAVLGEETELQLYRAGANMAGDYGTAHEPIKKEVDVYYAKAEETKNGNVTTWTKLGTTDADGKIKVNTETLGKGEFILAVEGRPGVEITDAICSAPGGIRLNIVKEPVDIRDAEITVENQVFNGKKLTPKPVVKVDGITLKENTDYTVSYKNNVNAGTATVSIQGIDAFTGTKDADFRIAKANNTLKVKAKKVKVKAAKVQKKAQKISKKKAFKISGAKGNTTFRISGVKKAKYKKYFKINKKTGTITVKKGLKKGTYKVKVKVSAAGNNNYKPLTRTVTVKVRVR